MKNIKIILKFSWQYVYPYRSRLAAAIIFGLLFGLSNAGALWATKTLLSRMQDPASISAMDQLVLQGMEASSGNGSLEGVVSTNLPQEGQDPGWIEQVNDWKSQSVTWAGDQIEPWLPKRGRELDWRQLVGGLLFLPLVAGFRSFTDYFSMYNMAWVSEKMVNDLRIKILNILSGLSLDFFNRTKSGDTLTNINTDSTTLLYCFKEGIGHSIKDPFTILSVLGMLLWIDWQMTLGAMVLLPGVIVPLGALGRKARKAGKHIIEISVTQSSLIVEMIAGIRVIKAYGLETIQASRYADMCHNIFKHTMKWTRASGVVGPLIETVSMLGVGGMIVFIIYSGREFPDMITFLLGLIMFYAPVKKLAKMHILFEKTAISVHRLEQILTEKPSIAESKSPVAITQFADALRFKDITFRYHPESAPALQEINLNIPKGKKIGIAGESGSGKSSFINLIFRFYDPESGSIQWDGVDLRQVSLSSLRSQLALVSQEIVIFDQTVAENIACGRLGASREEVIEAARQANAHEFIMRLANQYDTPLGERGVNLSGGQRQRIAIARAFVRQAPILIFDEATASLDSKAELEVQKALSHMPEEQTVVVIAHRLSTLQFCDRIDVFSDGRIVESGTFEELLKARGAFLSMAEKQGFQ